MYRSGYLQGAEESALVCQSPRVWYAELGIVGPFAYRCLYDVVRCQDVNMNIRESHAVILRDRVVPASQVPFPGEPSGYLQGAEESALVCQSPCVWYAELGIVGPFAYRCLYDVVRCQDVNMNIRESHPVILRDRVVPASQVPFPGEPSGEPGNGT